MSDGIVKRPSVCRSIERVQREGGSIMTAICSMCGKSVPGKMCRNRRCEDCSRKFHNEDERERRKRRKEIAKKKIKNCLDCGISLDEGNKGRRCPECWKLNRDLKQMRTYTQKSLCSIGKQNPEGFKEIYSDFLNEEGPEMTKAIFGDMLNQVEAKERRMGR
jgi:hypothetical protein